MHKKASVAYPTSHPTVKQLCQALRRLHSGPIHPKPPLSPLQFKEVFSCLAWDGAPLADIQKATIFALGFWGWKSASLKNCYKCNSLEDALSVSRVVLQKRLNLARTMLSSSWLSSITLVEEPSFLGLLTICISPIEQCALVL